MYLQVCSVIHHLDTPKSKYQHSSGRLAVPVWWGTVCPQVVTGPASWQSVCEYHQLSVTLLFTLRVLVVAVPVHLSVSH